MAARQSGPAAPGSAETSASYTASMFTVSVGMPNLSATRRACSASSGMLWQGMSTPSTPSGKARRHRTATTHESMPPLMPNTTPRAPAPATSSLSQSTSLAVNCCIWTPPMATV